jgi:hypothetical protein
VGVRLDDLDVTLLRVSNSGAPPSLRQRSDVLNAAALALWRLISPREVGFARRSVQHAA